MISNDEIMALEDRHGSGLVTNQPIILVRGQGARLWDADGREYIDCVGGHGVANIGHANPDVAKALCEQAQTLLVGPAGYYNDKRSLLLGELTRIAPPGLDRAFLCNSGAEANEAAFKFARVATGRTRIIAAMRGFHGRTVATATMTTSGTRFSAGFSPLMGGVHVAPFPTAYRYGWSEEEATVFALKEGSFRFLLKK